MLTFNIGPSKLSKESKQDIKNAVDFGIAEISHRSSEFSQISESAVTGMKKFLHIPDDYHVFYTSSATDAMHSAIANTCAKNSFHFICGSFSERFQEVASSLGKTTQEERVPLGERNNYQTTNIPGETNFISLCHNETSTGIMCASEDIIHLKKKYPDSILAVDMTSSAGIIPVNIADMDIVVFSVQKGFSLPAGLGIIIVSPEAYACSIELEKKKQNLAGLYTFSAIKTMLDNNYFTIPTPNILDIYLLAKQLERWNQEGGLQANHQKAQKKYEIINDIIASHPRLNFLVQKPEYRSISTVCVSAEETFIKELLNKCKEADIILGGGYGELKDTTLRIGNFPAHTIEDFESLRSTLANIK